MKPENTEYVKSQLIINTIKKRVNNKPINLGFIGGGEPLIEKKLILNIISNIKPIKFLSITTNGLLLDEEFFQQLHSFDNVDKIFWNISINYINFDFILKNIRELKEIFRGEKIFLLIYINDKYDIILLKRGIKELLSYNMFIIKIKPIILDGVIQSHDEYYSIVKYFIQVAKNNTIFDFMENCTNLRLQSYFAIDCFGRIYKCHAQAGLTKGCSEDKPYEYGICIHCCYFPICLGGCFPYGDRPFDQNSCAFFNHITTIINIYLNQFKLVDIKGI
jgi:MoaA/NifB/PqqE/SkfB family radical SAM enzyme